MKRKRRPASFPFLCGDWWRAGLRASEMMMNSAEVISHRSRMMAGAMQGELPLYDAEFQRMWAEKIAAGMDACQAWCALVGSGALNLTGFEKDWAERLMSGQLRAFEALSGPYHRKSRANARRLRRKKS